MKRFPSQVSYQKRIQAQYKCLIPAKSNVTCGVKERAEVIIGTAAMRVAEKEFWAKRGFKSPPGITFGGVCR